MAGFIYIMSNPAFPNLLKIGKSKKDPTTDRVNELNQTGVPEPFKVEYYAFVEDEDYLEGVVHKRFAVSRPNKSREFFNIDCVAAIEAIRELSVPYSKIKYEEFFYVSPEEIARYRREREEARDRRFKEEAAAARREAQSRADAERKQKEEKQKQKQKEEQMELERKEKQELLNRSKLYRLGIWMGERLKPNSNQR